MKRKQIYLDERCEQRLKTVAMRRGCSEAAVIREALENLLRQEEGTQAPGESNPLLSLIGMAESGKEDAAVNHDRYLYIVDR